MMRLKYATVKPLKRARDVFTQEELRIKGLAPDTKVSDNSPTVIIEQKWSKDPNTLLTTGSFEELLNIEDKTVGIVHGRCEPPLITIDPDNKEKADMLMSIVQSLPKHQQPLVTSKGIGKAGYNFTYHDTPDNKLMLDFIHDIHQGGKGDDIDVLSGAGSMMFMANKGNHTKQLVSIAKDTTTIRPVPIPLQLAVMGLFKDARPQHLDTRKEAGSYLPEHTNQTVGLHMLILSNTLLMDFSIHVLVSYNVCYAE